MHQKVAVLFKTVPNVLLRRYQRSLFCGRTIFNSGKMLVKSSVSRQCKEHIGIEISRNFILEKATGKSSEES